MSPPKRYPFLFPYPCYRRDHVGASPPKSNIWTTRAGFHGEPIHHGKHRKLTGNNTLLIRQVSNMDIDFNKTPCGKPFLITFLNHDSCLPPGPRRIIQSTFVIFRCIPAILQMAGIFQIVASMASRHSTRISDIMAKVSVRIDTRNYKGDWLW